MNGKIRTRFAPSPTGYLHVGGARTALFNYLFAKATKGEFILRIEDTDQERSTEISLVQMIESLKWLGLNWDEGYQVGGNFGPYRQSERLDIYHKYADILLREKKAYRCFCSTEELEQKKRQKEAMGLPPVYDGKCRFLTEDEVQNKLKNNLSFTVRFKIEPGEICVKDIAQGDVYFDASLIGDFIILKSDQFPSYNYAVVIDDHLMEITHVIRGVGHLSNTPRQIMIYKSFGWLEPVWLHVSEIVGSDHKKLSKRHGATSVTVFRDLGYPVEAFVNYMALLGWSSPDNSEYMALENLISKFDINRCGKSPSMFDIFDINAVADNEIGGLPAIDIKKYLAPKSKLNWISNQTIQDKTNEQYLKEVLPFVKKEYVILGNGQGNLDEILLALRVYLDYYLQINDYIGDFFDIEQSYPEDAMEYIKKPFFKNLVSTFKTELTSIDTFEPSALKETIKKVGDNLGIKGKDLFMSIRIATTGKTHGLELPSYLSLLGKERVIKRIGKVLEYA